MKKFIALALLISFVALLGSTAIAEDNVIFTELVQKGVPLSNGKTIKLPDPVMADGLDQAAQLKVMKSITDEKHLESFLKGGLSDHFELKKDKTTGSKKEDSLGRQIDLYFVGQGTVETAASSDFTKKLLNQNDPNAPGKAEFFTDNELKSRKLTVTNSEKMKERYAHAFNKILGKVEVSGSGRGIKTVEPDSIMVASKLEPRFADDPKYPNQWQSITTVNGRAVLGNPEKYSGLGAYIKITKLAGPEEPRFRRIPFGIR